MIRSLPLAVACLALAACFSPVDENFDGGSGGGGFPGGGTGGGFGGGTGGGTGGGFGGGTGGGTGGGFGGGTGGGFGGGTGGGFGGGFGGGGVSCDGCRTAGGTCLPLANTSELNCGFNGSACVTCSDGEICSRGLCSPPPTRKRVGDSCAFDGECQQSLGGAALCKQRTSSGNASYAGGYCTLRCASTAGQCPVGSTCVSVVASYGESDSLCWDNCSATDSCRSPGYACYGIGNVNACWISPRPPVGGGAGGGGGGGAPVGGGTGGGGFGGGTGGGIPVGGGTGGGFGGGTGGGFPVGGGTGGGFGGGTGGGTPVGGGFGGGGGQACDGCFFSGFCIPRTSSNNDTFCGQGGVTCASCSNGQTCRNFTCVNGPVGGGGGGAFDGGPVGGGFGGGMPTGGGGGSVACSAATCSGCCSNNFCVPLQSQSNFTCGLRGNQCASCFNGLTCSSGACTSPDAGPSQVGNACTTDTQCRPPTSGFCIAETVFGMPTGWPGGACSANCGTTACPSGSSCLDVGGGGSGSNPICFQSCPQPRIGQSTCRVGYVCEVNVQTTGSGICIPRCNTAGFTCWQGTRCDVGSGFCVAGP